MKTIEVSDEDYENLMELSKELQTQPHHGQAFPRFWEPHSEYLVLDYNDEGEVEKLIYRGEEIDLEDAFESDEEDRCKFLEANGYDPDLTFTNLTEDQRDEFKDFLIRFSDVESRTYNWEGMTLNNPSLFLSDVQEFVKCNPHHLGRNPTTFSRSFWRMPKMENLVRIICEMNKDCGGMEDVKEDAFFI